MKLEVRRRDSLPTISGLVTQNIQRPMRTVGVQTSGGPGEPDIVRPYLYFIYHCLKIHRQNLFEKLYSVHAILGFSQCNMAPVSEALPGKASRDSVQ